MKSLYLNAVTFLFVSASVFTTLGCSSEVAVNRADELKAFGMSYAKYASAYGKAPTSWDDMLGMLDEMGMVDDKATIQSMKDSAYVFRGDASMDGKSAADVALVYHPDALENGGDAFFADGSVGPVTADELKKAIE